MSDAFTKTEGVGTRAAVCQADRRLTIMEAHLPARAKAVPEMFGAGNPGNSIYWEDLALDPR
jgi:hypothetical protein